MRALRPFSSPSSSAASVENPYINQPDNSLIQMAGVGDKQAFREIVRRYRRKVINIAVGLVRDRSDAEDIATDVWMRVYRHLDDLKGQASFSTFLYRITVNLAIDLIRRREPHKRLALDEVSAEDRLKWFTQGTDVLERLPDREADRKIVRQILDELPEYHATVLKLRLIEGLSYEEIAEAMEIPKGTVMSRLFHAKRRLARRFRELSPDSDFKNAPYWLDNDDLWYARGRF